MSTDKSQRLLAQIDAAVLDESTPVAAVLRKCVVLAGRSGSTSLREWASRELNGYTPDDAVPEYRKLLVEIQVDGISGFYKITGETISVLELPDYMRDVYTNELEMRQGVGAIEEMAQQASNAGGHVKLGPPASAEAARLLTHEFANKGREVSVGAIYWSVAEASLRSIVDQVRTKLAELVAELRASAPDDEPSSENVNQAVNVVINGKGRTRIGNIVTSQALSGSKVAANSGPEEEPWWSKVPKAVWALLTGAAAIVTAWFSYVMIK